MGDNKIFYFYKNIKIIYLRYLMLNDLKEELSNLKQVYEVQLLKNEEVIREMIQICI